MKSLNKLEKICGDNRINISIFFCGRGRWWDLQLERIGTHKSGWKDEIIFHNRDNDLDVLVKEAIDCYEST